MTALIGGHALLNTESAVALGFLLALFVRSRPGSLSGVGNRDGNSAPVWLAIYGAVLIVYRPAMISPFVYDDDTHLADARRADWRAIAAEFGGAAIKPAMFFRPFGALLYWMNYVAAGENARWWHAGSLALHAGVSCLLFTLGRELRLGFAGSFSAAILFALSGAAVETAVWIDARFDLVATLLTLLSLILVCRYCASGRVWLLAFACAAGWALGGMGGDNSAHFNAARLGNAIFVRDWTILLFPVNWSEDPGWWLAGLLATAPLGLAICAWRARMSRRVLAAALPAHQLLLIGTDLANSRCLYLPTVGWVILWGAIIGSVERAHWRMLLTVWIVAWNLTMLRHDLAFWLRVPAEARQVCADLGATVAAREGSAVVAGLLQRKEGVVLPGEWICRVCGDE